MPRARVFLFAVAACFRQPPAPSPALDAPPACTNPSAWGMPAEIALGIDYTANAVTSPWLSDKLDTVYFAILPGGESSMALIARSQSSDHGLSWSTPDNVALATPPGAADDNPFLADDGTLWFDSSRNSPRMIYEVPSDGRGGFDAPIAHTELLAAKEPSLTPDGNTIFWSPDGGTGINYARRQQAGAFGPTTFLTTSDADESASVTGDGGTLYYSSYSNMNESIELATIAGDSLGSPQPFAAYEASETFFDPSITRDGTHLVFASTYQGTIHPHIYYATRTCD